MRHRLHWHRLPPRLAGAIVGAVLATGAMGVAASGGSPSGPAPHPNRLAAASSRLDSRPTAWILAYAHFDQVIGGRGVAGKLRDATFYEVLNLKQKPSTLLPAVGTLDFHSYARMRQVLSQPLPSYIRAVIYDNERNASTPPAEQARPAYYTTLAVALANARHLKIICDYIEPDRVPGGVVPASDVVALDTVQQSERSVSAYEAKVRQLVAAIHAVRPGVPIAAGLSSDPARPKILASVLADDMDAVQPLVNGFWLNVPAPGVGCAQCGLPEPGVMAAALQQWRPSAAAGATALGARIRGAAWILAASAVAKLPAADELWLRRQGTVAVLQPAKATGGSSGVESRWADATSLSAAASVAANSHAADLFAAILLDLERWPFTPTAEQSSPVRTAQEAAAAAHRTGLDLVEAPALDLFAGARSPAAAMLAAHLYGRLARVVDGIEIQAQGLELHPSAYRSFVLAAVAQARSAHPGIPIWVGLSTNPSAGVPTLATLLADVRSVRSEVQGFWLNIPSPGPACPRCHASDPALGAALLHAFGAPAP